MVYIGERGTSDAPKKSPKKVAPRRMGLSAIHSIALASHDEGLPTNRGKDRMLIDSKPTRKDNHMSCVSKKQGRIRQIFLHSLYRCSTSIYLTAMSYFWEVKRLKRPNVEGFNGFFVARNEVFACLFKNSMYVSNDPFMCIERVLEPTELTRR